MIKNLIILSFIFLNFTSNVIAQENSIPDFVWGNASYFNLNVGDKIVFENKEIELLQLNNYYNKIRVAEDTTWMKVSQRTLAKGINGLRVFIADNKNIKELTDDSEVHGLLKKEVLICVSNGSKPLLEPNDFIFPISFNDGYLWSVEEDSYMFSYMGLAEINGKKFYRSHEGIDFDLHDARGIEKHWVVALENSTVVWVRTKDIDEEEKQACVLLESESQPGIYFLYQHLYRRNREVHKGQKVVRGELIGTVWGEEEWGNLHLSVIKSDSIPSYENRFYNQVNFFPQIYNLYFKQLFGYSKSFTKGTISFGKKRAINGNEKNALAFEEYVGKGWILEEWNKPNKLPTVSLGLNGNVRLRKKLFSGSKAFSVNSNNWFDYEINVNNGIYRIRAKVGDAQLPSWQKVSFEGVNAGTYSLDAGEYKWTKERAVKVKDKKLTIRVYVEDGDENTTAGISEIVFQRAEQ